MKQILFGVCAALLLACGGQDSNIPSVESAGEALEGAAEGLAEQAGDVADEARGLAEQAGEAASDAMSGDAANCLELVRGGQFAEAIPVCTQALSLDSSNQEVQDALDTARERVADMGIGDAEEAGEAVEDLGEQLPDLN